MSFPLSSRATTPRYLGQETLTIRYWPIKLADRAGQGVAQFPFDLVEGLGHLLLGDRRQVEAAAGCLGLGGLGREEVANLVLEQPSRPPSAAPPGDGLVGESRSSRARVGELGDDPGHRTWGIRVALRPG